MSKSMSMRARSGVLGACGGSGPPGHTVLRSYTPALERGAPAAVSGAPAASGVPPAIALALVALLAGCAASGATPGSQRATPAPPAAGATAASDPATSPPAAPGATEAAVRAIADRVLHDATFQLVDSAGNRYARPEQAPGTARLRPASGYHDWRYWNGVLGIAMVRLTDVLGDPGYAGFARRNVAFAFDVHPWFEARYDGRKWEYPFAQRFVMEELDDYGAEGAATLEVYRLDPQPRYRAYAEAGGAYALTRQNRLPDGTLVRAFPRRWTLWADDLYMGLSLLTRLGELTGDSRYFDDAARQVLRFHEHLFDARAGLMAHNWYSETDRRGVAFWGRANGWALLAQADLLDRLPRGYPQRDTLLTLFRRHIDGVLRYQSAGGLWHQVLDHDDSYLETSASAMFTYAIARAVDQGWLEPRYAAYARRGWAGVRTRIRTDGQVEGVCAGTNVSDDLQDYYARPTPLNDPHGLGTVLLAGTEMLRLERGTKAAPRGL